MAENKIITVWERYNDNAKSWEHNHIEDGFDENAEQPTPKGSVQEKSWPGGKWRKHKAHLEGITVVLD
ncbi:MAG: hypothetical protein GC149_06580 [Gammaproteobacteria bacterium]|nr:hypothetical protein [Gammaproteobacteria bacterium]